MRSALIALTIVVLLLSFLVGYQFINRKKLAFVYTTTVFDKFDGTTHFQQKMDQAKLEHKKYLDSLLNLVKRGRKELASQYAQQADYFETIEEQQGEQYTKEIWKYINESIQEFGDKNGYDFIYGASGNGALMYADSSRDVTDDLLRYLQMKYKGDNP